MDTAQLTIIVGAITTIAAIIGPILGSIVSNHYALKLKRMELNYPRIFDTITDLTNDYRSLYRNGELPSEAINKDVPAARYYSFLQACRKITALLPSVYLFFRIRRLLFKLEEAQYCRSPETDADFNAILEIISIKSTRKL